MSEQEKESFKLIDASADLMGVLAAGITTATLYHDVSTIVGGTIAVGVAHAFRYCANLSVNRVLAKREQARVGAVYALAAHDIKGRLDRGERPRSDDFFDRDLSDRSKADEIAEAILVSAQREHQEKKLPRLANLLAFIIFEPRIDDGMANYMIKIADALTYRQYCVLAIAMNSATAARLSRQPNTQGAIASQGMAARSEIFDLYEQRLVGFSRGPILEPNDMPLEQLRLNEFGPYLHLGLGLSAIPSEDVAALIRVLHGY